MKPTQKQVMIVAFCFLLAACGKEVHVSPELVETNIVGKYEDCTLYRTITTRGPDVTWVRCKKEPKVVESQHTESCGKGCTRKVLTTTIEDAQ